MRFEIKSGGIAAILVGIAALSGAVFMLGLLAGYDVGRESQSSAAQIATAYPVAPPAGNVTVPAVALPSPSPAASDADSAPDAGAAPPPVAAANPAKHSKAAARTEAAADDDTDNDTDAPPPPAVKAPRASADTRHASADTGDDLDTDTEARRPAPAPTHAPVVASASTNANSPAASHGRHRPYNIQIEAVMDNAGATEMVQRLQALGFQSHLVPAQLNGQTWYKVVIGPYPTQEAAAAAQSAMRAKYNSTYGGRTAAGPSAP